MIRSALKISLLIIAIFLIACGEKKEAASPSSEWKPTQTDVVSREPVRIEVAGTIRAADVAQMSTRFAGFVSQIRVKAGASVKKGDLMVVIDDRNLKAQAEKLDAARTELDQALREARFQQEAAQARQVVASNTFERIRKLYEKDAASRQEYEEAESGDRAARASLEAAGQRVSQMEAKILQTESDQKDTAANLQYVRLTAPFDGVVASVPAQQGTFVSPGQPLVTVEGPAAFEVIFSVEENLLPIVRVGQEISLLVNGSRKEPLTATVTEVSSAADVRTRTFQVKARLSSNDDLRSGISATAQLDSPDKNSLWIPASFLSRTYDVETVWVQQGDNWQRVLVKSGSQKGDKVEILSGLNEGDRIGRQEPR